MKKFSAPPMIIILDVLFMVMFVLVLEQSPDIKIILPENRLNDVIIVSTDKNKEVKHWYSFKSNAWEGRETFPIRNRKYEFMIGNIDCEQYDPCTQLTPLNDETKKVYIKGDLYDEISGMIADSCLKFPKQCANVTYNVTKNGHVDREKLQNKYQIFRHILIKSESK